MSKWSIHLPVNPAKIDRPSLHNGRERVLGEDEYQRLLHACANGVNVSNIWIRPLVELAVETAMRKGELLALNWGDVSLDARSVSVNKTVHGERTKNDDTRVVPLSPNAVKVLKSLPRGGDESPVFCTTYNAAKLSFQRAVRRAKINNFTFHDLRHMATSQIGQKIAKRY